MNGKNKPTKHQVELVITVPELYGAQLAYRVHARMTLGVLTQLISQAKRFLVIATPFLQPTEILKSGPVADALHSALCRSIDVDIVSTGSGLRMLDVETLRGVTPGRLRFFRPIANVEDEKRLGSHAKFCIADGEHAYVGSANLTSAGLGENLEMGFLVHGELARQVEQFWYFLTEIGFFVEARI